MPSTHQLVYGGIVALAIIAIGLAVRKKRAPRMAKLARAAIPPSAPNPCNGFRINLPDTNEWKVSNINLSASPQTYSGQCEAAGTFTIEPKVPYPNVYTKDPKVDLPFNHGWIGYIDGSGWGNRRQIVFWKAASPGTWMPQPEMVTPDRIVKRS